MAYVISRIGIAPAPQKLRPAFIALLAFALVVSACIALLVGSTSVSLGRLADAALHPLQNGFAHTILWDLRLPRVCIAACVGAGLGVAGAMLQALFRNPLVDPYVSGVSAGAALAATLAIATGISFAFIPVIAFAGGLICAAVVAFIGAGAGATGNLRLVLAGVAVSALCSAAVTLVLLREAPSSEISVLSWLAGGIDARGWPELKWAAGYLAAGMFGAATLVHGLNVLRLGTPAAAGFGLRVERARWLVLGFAALITAACVAVSGVVGFVGLMVPHGARRLVGGGAAWLLPASALGGATVVIVADALARSLLPPSEIPLGVLLAVVGVPFFLAIARKPVEL